MIGKLHSLNETTKGADQGIDGRLYFHDEKGGSTKPLLSMEPPTKSMLKEATEAGFYQSPGLTDKYPRIQILSIAELLVGKKLDYPRFALDQTFKKAPKAKSAAAAKVPLPFDTATDPDEPF